MCPFLSRLSSSLLLLTLTLPLAAQQKVCLSVHNGPATGTNSLGQPAQLAARVEGVQVSVPTTAGQTSAQASAAHEAAFVAAGFTTSRTNPNEFCVTAAPGGAPITRGSCYGTDDMGLDLDSDVSRLVPPPAGDPKTKDNGAVVPLPPVQQPPMPQGGVITVTVWIRVGSTHVQITIQIVLPANAPGLVLRQVIVQQLQMLGLMGNIVTVRSPLQPSLLIDVLQLERTAAGDAIDGIEYAYDAMSRRIVNNVTGAGLYPEYGACEYGVPTQGLATRMPLSQAFGMPPAINSFFDVFHDVGLPNAIGGFLLAAGPFGFPVFNGVLLVDPTTLMIELAVTPASGTLTRHWVVPPAPGLIGFPLHSQGFAVTSGVFSMSTGLAAIIGP